MRSPHEMPLSCEAAYDRFQGIGELERVPIEFAQQLAHLATRGLVPRVSFHREDNRDGRDKPGHDAVGFDLTETRSKVSKSATADFDGRVSKDGSE